MEAPELVTVTWPEHTQVLLDGIWNAFTDRYQVDVEVTCNGHSRPVAAHQVILGIFCPILKRHLEHDATTTNKVNKVSGRRSLEYDLSGSDFDLLLEFVYRGQVKLPRDRLDGLEKVAVALGVHGLVGAIDKLRNGGGGGDRDHMKQSPERHFVERRGAKKRKGIPVKIQKNGRRSSNEEDATLEEQSQEESGTPTSDVEAGPGVDMRPTTDDDGEEQPMFLGIPGMRRHESDPNGRHPVPTSSYLQGGSKPMHTESRTKARNQGGVHDSQKRTLWFRERGAGQSAPQCQTLGKDFQVTNLKSLQTVNDGMYQERATSQHLGHGSSDVQHTDDAHHLRRMDCLRNPPETGQQNLEWTLRTGVKRGGSLQPPLSLNACNLDDHQAARDHHHHHHHHHDLALQLQQQQFLAHYQQASVAAAATVSSANLVDKPHKCPECNYTADLKSVVNRHVRSKHRNERPYGCETCGFRSKTRSAYNMHVRSHNEVKPFNCHICGQGYTRRINLKAHMQKHSN